MFYEFVFFITFSLKFVLWMIMNRDLWCCSHLTFLPSLYVGIVQSVLFWQLEYYIILLIDMLFSRIYPEAAISILPLTQYLVVFSLIYWVKHIHSISPFTNLFSLGRYYSVRKIVHWVDLSTYLCINQWVFILLKTFHRKDLINQKLRFLRQKLENLI